MLTSIAIDNGVYADGAQWCLWVPYAEALRANAELGKHSQENRPRFAPRPQVVTIDSGWPGVLCFLLVVWLLPSLEAATTFGWHWRAVDRRRRVDVGGSRRLTGGRTSLQPRAIRVSCPRLRIDRQPFTGDAT